MIDNKKEKVLLNLVMKSSFEGFKMPYGAFKFIVATIAISVILLTSPGMAAHTERVSLDMEGKEAISFSQYPSLSGDGRYVAFMSHASNLVPNDNNGCMDVFVHDRVSRKIERISISSTGAEGNDHSTLPSISANGHIIAFESDASNLVPGDTNKKNDVFVHDLSTGKTERISVSNSGKEGNGNSHLPSISPDGRFVAFYSNAGNLIPGDINNNFDVFVYHRQTKEIKLVSHTPGKRVGNDESACPSISNNGAFIAFQSKASDLIAKDINKKMDIFVYEAATSRIRRVSEVPSGPIRPNFLPGGNDHSMLPAISVDGRFVAFESGAGNLVQGDLNGCKDVFRYEMATGITIQVSINDKGWGGNKESSGASISQNGRFIAFESRGDNFVPNDNNTATDIFLHDTKTKKTSMVSIDTYGVHGNNFSFSPSISMDGKFVGFQSQGDNLVRYDMNTSVDIFVHGVINSSGQVQAHDYNGDGVSDILWRDPKTGKNALWALDNFKIRGAGWLPPKPPDWIPSTADFDGDRKTDIFWLNTKGGQHVIWLMNGNLVRKRENFPPLQNPWRLAGFGDFNGDEKADMLWYNEKDGRSFITLMDGGTILESDWLRTFKPNWEKIAGLGDFDGDGKTDILWNEQNGNNTIWFMYGMRKSRSVATRSSFNVQVFGIGDFNGDTMDDILWYQPGTDFYSIWHMQGASVLKWWKPPTMGAALCIGDFNGDKWSDILWFSKKKENYIWDSKATGATIPFRYLPRYDPGWVVVR